jgi:hypothetical protein
VHPDIASAAGDLPTPVLALIAAVAGGILLLVGHELNERIRRSRHN